MLMEMALVIDMLNGKTDVRTAAEQHCLIENVVYEAANQGVRGMRLVTEVVLQRHEHEYRQKYTQCGVIHDTAQFSWTNDPVENRRSYSDEEYQAAAQVVFSYLYNDLPRLLPEGTLHYLNPKTASDMSWYKPSKVVYRHKDHEFLAGIR